MSYKDIRKCNKKQKRSSHMLFRETGIKTCDRSRILMICNAGLVSGIQREEVINLFLPFGKLEDVCMLPGKSYCFVAFRNEEDAQEAYSVLHGKTILNATEVKLILAFVESVPKTDHDFKSSSWPNGLILLKDFITEVEEDLLIRCVNWDTGAGNSGRALKHRRVRHYGYEFRYDNNNVDKDDPLPEDLPKECSFFEERLFQRSGIRFKPDQLTVNEYHPGQGIPPHIDTHSAFEGIIASLSLGSLVVMEFKHTDGRHASVPLPRRSLVLMTGESRYAWTHGITPRKMDVVVLEEDNKFENGCLSVSHRGTRTSFTFRRILRGECCCNFPLFCDSFKKRESSSSSFKIESETANDNIDNRVAAKLESMHVHSVYEEIASHFSETRHKAWPNISNFVNDLPPGSILLDVGCGNGKYFGVNKNIFEIGCDQSIGLASVANKRGFQVFTSNCLHIPLKPGIADACICIAVIHHLSTKERRLQALTQIAEVLRPGGQALVYVWAKEQERDKVKSSYLRQMGKRNSGKSDEETSHKHCVSELDLSLPVHKNRTDFQHGDLFVPWKLKHDTDGKTSKEVPTFYRYYHVFEEGELETLSREILDIRILKSYYDQGNWCLLMEKSKE
ncbi:hypothetical protein J437_LFUL005873 [Ladona fulva]|uniref:tRNA (carboxymethyluridine(34)-5-O)-methyltransferase n=1 Tax=Ladona fulva TaxID=123851 RepID=A0A8K0P1P7_LADFU|nr:hypothetical protein J437_LFUL005873 [Ladona fulva]